MLQYQNSISFSAKNDMAAKAFKRQFLSDEDRILEHQRGLFAGIDALKSGVDVCREIIIRETIAGNFDYLKGFNQAIGSDMAKRAYASIANLAK